MYFHHFLQNVQVKKASSLQFCIDKSYNEMRNVFFSFVVADLTSSNACACTSKSRLTCHAYRKQTITRVTKVNM